METTLYLSLFFATEEEAGSEPVKDSP